MPHLCLKVLIKPFLGRGFFAKMSWRYALLPAVLMLVLVVAFLFSPGPLKQTYRFYIAPNMSLASVSDKLAQENVLFMSSVFYGLMWAGGQANSVYAGEYSFPAKANLWQVMRTIVLQKNTRRRFTVPEGLTSFRVVELLNSAPMLQGKIDVVPQEGSLLPETYFYDRGTSRAALLAEMRENMSDFVELLWRTRQAGLPFTTPQQAIILASIVEKETSVVEEMPHIASVFINRLKSSMRLQADPTVIYGITKGLRPLGRKLHRKDIRKRTRWNTYQIPSLPPTAIANPGKNALRAVFFPASTEDFYFVASQNGRHAFAKTLAEHNRNVKRWRLKRKLQR